ncbi:MAG: hypothetical protein LKG27_07330, partial [Clostridiaceae bacterium]|nr:hypothetical protein [Clostridiaceae bacterium]
KTIEKFQSKLTKHANASDEEKISMLMTYVDDIFSVNKDDEALLALTKKFPIGKNVRLGEIIDSGAGVCRHRSLLTKILGDHTGLNVSLVKGSYDDGAHAWNKFIASDGKKYLVDTMHRNLVNLSNDGIRDMRVLAYSQGRSSSYLYASEYQSTKKIFDYVLNNQPISLSGKATLYNTNGKFTLYPIENQKVTLNGKALQTASFIRNGDRIKYEGLDGKQVSIIWKTPNL